MINYDLLYRLVISRSIPHCNTNLNHTRNKRYRVIMTSTIQICGYKKSKNI